jgi:hypothetical protein
MNSTPADSKARRMASSLAEVSDVPSSATSARLIVFTPTEDSRAKSTALHRNNARAALICALVIPEVRMLTLNPIGFIKPILGFTTQWSGQESGEAS